MTEQIEKTAAFVRRKLADERGGVCHGDRHDAVAGAGRVLSRSEERRVGKEC